MNKLDLDMALDRYYDSMGTVITSRRARAQT
jgi:hypothetical protein